MCQVRYKFYRHLSSDWGSTLVFLICWEFLLWMYRTLFIFPHPLKWLSIISFCILVLCCTNFLLWHIMTIWWYETRKINSYTVLQNRGLKSMCWQDHLLSKDVRVKFSLPLPASGSSWGPLASRSITPICALSSYDVPVHV